jgi:hypothetical protein
MQPDNDFERVFLFLQSQPACIAASIYRRIRLGADVPVFHAISSTEASACKCLLSQTRRINLVLFILLNDAYLPECQQRLSRVHPLQVLGIAYISGPKVPNAPKYCNTRQRCSSLHLIHRVSHV